MKTYTELKQEEKQIKETIETLKEEIRNEINKLMQLASHYPEEFRILPKKNILENKLDVRIDFIKEEIKESEAIEELQKENLTEELDKIKNTVKENTESIAFKEEEIELLQEVIKERKDFVLNQMNVIEENKTKIELLEKKQIYYQALIDNEDTEEFLKDSLQKALDKIEKEKTDLLPSNYMISALQEDIELIKEENNSSKKNEQKSYEEKINEEISKMVEKNELKETKKEIQKKDNNTETDKEVTAAVEEVFEKQEAAEKEKNNDEENSQVKEKIGVKTIIEKIKNTYTNGNSTSISSVTPEEEQEVVETHKAPSKLISNIKKYGKIGLGVTVIVSTIVAVATNPIVLAAFPAGIIGTKIYEHAKEKKKTK